MSAARRMEHFFSSSNGVRLRKTEGSPAFNIFFPTVVRTVNWVVVESVGQNYVYESINIPYSVKKKEPP